MLYTAGVDNYSYKCRVCGKLWKTVTGGALYYWSWNMDRLGRVFVTVGTTSFDKLIQTVSDASTLQVKGCYTDTFKSEISTGQTRLCSQLQKCLLSISHSTQSISKWLYTMAVYANATLYGSQSLSNACQLLGCQYAHAQLCTAVCLQIKMQRCFACLISFCVLWLRWRLWWG